jgi:hypothetical protein
MFNEPIVVDSYAFTIGVSIGISRYPLDASDRDKLTKYNGASVTYDNIGNPLDYRGWYFTWEEGRHKKPINNVLDTAAATSS